MEILSAQGHEARFHEMCNDSLKRCLFPTKLSKSYSEFTHQLCYCSSYYATMCTVVELIKFQFQEHAIYKICCKGLHHVQLHSWRI
jgi:hypothetical protein